MRIECLCGTYSHRLHLWTPNKPSHACAVKPEVLKSWSLEIDYSRASCLGADQKARGLWDRDWSFARAHERVRVQNLRDFPQTKLDSEINAPFLLNEHGDPRFFILVFAKNSLIKNIFEEGKKIDSIT